MMSDKFRIPRTCTNVQPLKKPEITTLSLHRNSAAYVLLGEPGAGKSFEFDNEEKLTTNGKLVKARDFLSELLADKHTPDTVYFIDGLDELRVGEVNGKSPLDQIRVELKKLGGPKFRLSCREADWLGSSDVEALRMVSPDETITVLHLNPLKDNDVKEFLDHSDISDSEKFIEEARRLNLAELLTNPQTLILLIDAVKTNNWPDSRTAVYEMACLELIKETNKEHRDAKGVAYSNIQIINAAGYLSAVLLLAGVSGYAKDTARIDSNYAGLESLNFHDHTLLLRALKSKLFKSEGEERFGPTHRSVAEYLGGKYLAEQVENEGLSIRRIASLMCGFDGGLVPDLRGLAAWFAVHSSKARLAFIDNDPLGVILYGDTMYYPIQDKKLLLNTLHKEITKNPWLRSGEWITHPFGGLATNDMEPTLISIIVQSTKSDADQAFLDCVLDALNFGNLKFSDALIEALNNIVLNEEFWLTNRNEALSLLFKDLERNKNRILAMPDKIIDGSLEDREDEILGYLLKKLYPKFITSKDVLKYLHPLKKRDLIGNYLYFWEHNIAELSRPEDVRVLLNTLIADKDRIKKFLNRLHGGRFFGSLLVKGLDYFGTTLSDEELYDWLGLGVDEYDHTDLETSFADHVKDWFVEHPERYKDVINAWISLCLNSKVEPRFFYYLLARLQGALEPVDMDVWYVKKAEEYIGHPISQELFQQAFISSMYRSQTKKNGLEFYEALVEKIPAFENFYKEMTASPIRDWQKENAQSRNKYKDEQNKRKKEWIDLIEMHRSDVANGTAPAHVLHNLSLAYEGLLIEANGDTPLQRLGNFLNNNSDLVTICLNGFKNSVFRKDLPEVSEIFELDRQRRMHLIRMPVLVGIKIIFDENPLIIDQLDNNLLQKLIAFKLTNDIGEDPPWFDYLCINFPQLVANLIHQYVVPLVKAGKEHISTLYSLAHNENYIEIAKLVLPKILDELPTRVKSKAIQNTIDPLLRSAMLYLPKEAAIKIVKHKLSLKSMDNAQRTYWYGCALLLEPRLFELEVKKFIGDSQTRSNYLGQFLQSSHGKQIPYDDFPSSILGMLIQIMAPGLSTERANGWVSPAHHKADLVRELIYKLGTNMDDEAAEVLSDLAADPKLKAWNYQLTTAKHSQKLTKRKATFQHIEIPKIVDTLMNKQPSSAADLWALGLDQIKDLANFIRNGNTDTYKLFWNVDHQGRITDNVPENECRNRLLAILKDRLSKYRIDALPEGNYADQKRADIRLSYGGFNIPIEIKLDKHRDLWKAIDIQLIPKYIRDPDTDGYGIFVVFWVGGQDLPLPPDGNRPKTALELENKLIANLDEDVRNRIGVCVFDVARPM